MEKILSKIKEFFKKIWGFLVKYKKFILAPIAAFLIIIALIRLYEIFYGYYITVRFEELGSLSKSMPVYYKGYRVGDTRGVRPSDDFQDTLVRVLLKEKRLKLPINTIAKINTLKDETAYLELIYPKEPSDEYIVQGSVIEGKTTVDLDAFISSQLDSGAFNKLTDNAANTLESIEETSDEIRELVADFREILKDNRENIKKITTNTAGTTKNLTLMVGHLANISLTVNESLKPDKIGNIVSNIDDSTKNVKDITSNINTATKELDDTMRKVDCIVSALQATTENINDITGGLLQSLKTNLAAVKIFFGRPIKADYKSSRPCKCKCLK